MRSLVFLLLAACAACESDDLEGPKILSIEIFPDPVPSLRVGQSIRLVAIADIDSASINWSSSNANVATVNSEGLVLALDTGITYVRARAARGSARDSVQVNVVTSVPPWEERTISISSVVSVATGQAINSAAVSGVVRLTARVDAPEGVTIGTVRVMVRDREMCRENTAGRLRFDHVCVIDTTQLPNGSAMVDALLVSPDGITLATAGPFTWNLAN